MRFLAAVGDRLATWAAEGRHAVLTGDLNIAHRVEDLKNWKGNRGKSGFLPEEQAQIDGWIGTHGFVDVHRHLHGPGPGPYTWWSWRGKAFDSDAGWRIDYQLASAPLAATGGAGRGRPGEVVRRALERPRPGLGHLRPLTRFPARSGTFTFAPLRGANVKVRLGRKRRQASRWAARRP